MSKTVFNSTLDEALMQQLHAARGGAPGPKVSKARKAFDYTDCQPMSTVFAVEGKVTQDIPVKRRVASDWDPSVRMHIPKRDPHYIFEATTLETFLGAMYCGDAILLHGPKGCGKTTLDQQVCAYLGIPYVRINMKEEVESVSLFGGVTFNPEKGVVFIEGPLAEFGRHGGHVCIDEVSRGPAGVINSLMAILERGTDIYLMDKPGTSEEKTIKRHPDFRIICTDNTELQGDTTGKYVGTNVQDEALIDRFNTTMRLDYLPANLEFKIIHNKVPELESTAIQQMIVLAGMIRSAYDSGNIGFTMSARGLVEWGGKSVFWDDTQRGFKVTFFNKLIPSDRKVVAEFYHSVFAENIR